MTTLALILAVVGVVLIAIGALGTNRATSPDVAAMGAVILVVGAVALVAAALFAGIALLT